MIIAGVEEAGRGPVVGPMVMAICSIDKSKEAKLKQLGVKDSKQLSKKKREYLVQKIKTLCDVDLIILTPQDIDDALNSSSMNLNLLEAVTTTRLIDRAKPDKVILDLPSNNAQKYVNSVKTNLKHDLEIIAEHKADVNYPIVSAASIVAKTVRDKEIEKLEVEIGKKIGSGYPSDPYTIKFLNENWNKHPEVFRQTWKTYKKVKRKHGQGSLSNF